VNTPLLWSFVSFFGIPIVSVLGCHRRQVHPGAMALYPSFS
jgi:hypothetical protein